MSRSIYEKIKSSGKLPSPSGVALELMRMVDDPASTIEQVTRAVEADPAIASQLLKLVNSPLAGVSRAVASLSLAVRLLGLRTVKNLALGVSLLGASRKSVSQSFDFERFWAESLARGVAARNLAHHFGCCAADEAFTIGLLSRVGRLALATAFGSAYDAVLDHARTAPSASLAELERREFGIDQNELTAEMLTDWRLADVYCHAVRCQDAISEVPSAEENREVKIARLLHLVGAVATVLAGSEIYQEDLLALGATASRAGIDGAEFSRQFDALNDEWPKVASIFSVRAQAAPSLRETHTRARRGHRDVLVVDDDPSVLHLMSKLLRDAGYDVRTAGGGKEAFQLVHSEGLQLVIADWKMPEMDGLALCRAIRGSEGAGFVYLIILTGSTDEDSLAQAFEAGADDYLVKPCKKEELLSRLKAGVRAVATDTRIALQQRALTKANAELATFNQTLNRVATTDELTGLYNRREALRRLHELWSTGDRHGQPLACMMLDIDHFKRCNDMYGHDAGDAVLRATAHAVAKSARKGEVVFRLGGEEFLVTCPDATAEMAAAGAERIRAAVEANQVRHADHTLGVTISIGVAARTVATPDVDALLKAADQALYAAKQNGRNQVCVAGAPVSPPARPQPRQAEAERGAGAAEAPEPSAAGTVLVVDDDASSRRLLRRLLERDGFEVIEANDGEQALAAARERAPHVIVMDVDMPGMDGIECTRRLKADPALCACPVIIVSGHSDDAQVEAGLRAGAEEYVGKPVRHSEFVLRVRSMNRLQRSNIELMQSNAVRGEQARAMTILFELSRSLGTARDMQDIVDETVTATAGLLNCGRVSLMLPDEQRASLIIAGAVGVPDELRNSVRPPIGSGVAGRVFSSGAAVICNSESDRAGRLDRYETDFFASVPLASKALTSHEVVVGVLNITERHDARPFAEQEIEYLDLICNMAASALEQVRAAAARERAHAAIVQGLAKLAEHRDADTGRHLERVTQVALMLASELRACPRYAATIDEEYLKDLEFAMPLHDIGKVSVPDAILLKPGPLTGSEFEAVKRHTLVGASALESVIAKSPGVGFLAMARDIAHYHHERFNGTGYPKGLVAEQIPLAARIAAVADVYDALRTKRPYKEALSHEKAVAIILESSGSHFDPLVVEAFVHREHDLAALAARLTDNHHPAPKPDSSMSGRVVAACS
ncbi:Cyclic di-GMP phosphodiesterase response regulator RpfG [Phycisphaerae bacterium RAS1]|nr:Cyclic di-GMP phosphodiesterase response regulator RpfG [Phycisphaerae bacterium RAS1]